MVTALASRGATTFQASVLVALSAFVWGCWWIPLRAIDGYGLKGDWASVAVLGIAATCMAPLLRRRISRMMSAGAMVWATGLFFGAMFSTYQHGLITGDVVRVTLLFYLAPVWGSLLGIVFLGMRFSPLRALAIILGFAGAAVVLEFDGGIPMPRSLGEWMGLASGIVFAVGATFAHKVVGDYEMEKAWLSLIFGALLSFIFAVVNPVFIAPSSGQILSATPFTAAVVILILIPITWTMVWGAKKLDPGRVSLLLMFEVIAASVSYSLIAGEPYGIEKLIGTIMILAAGAVEVLAERRATASL